VLADVRNGTWGDPLKPISEPRGLPKDIDPVVVDDFEFGDHSQSWLTLAELQAYDWTRSVKKCAYVSPEVFERWDGTHPPREYAAWSSNGIPVAWEQPVSTTCEDFVEYVLPELARLGAPDDVRIVFGFDS
jgi:hypothetical protein